MTTSGSSTFGIFLCRRGFEGPGQLVRLAISASSIPPATHQRGLSANDFRLLYNASTLFGIASDLLPGEPRIMVGDSQANDVAGAQAAGWTGVWLNREGSATPKAMPDLMIRSLHELLPMAKALRLHHPNEGSLSGTARLVDVP